MTGRYHAFHRSEVVRRHELRNFRFEPISAENDIDATLKVQKGFELVADLGGISASWVKPLSLVASTWAPPEYKKQLMLC